jgi:hypothetical protein
MHQNKASSPSLSLSLATWFFNASLLSQLMTTKLEQFALGFLGRLGEETPLLQQSLSVSVFSHNYLMLSASLPALLPLTSTTAAAVLLGSRVSIAAS